MVQVEYHPDATGSICTSCGQFFRVSEDIGGTERVDCNCGFSYRFSS